MIIKVGAATANEDPGRRPSKGFGPAGGGLTAWLANRRRMGCLPGALVLACTEKVLVPHLGYGAYDIQKVHQPITARTLRPRDFDSFYVHHCRFAKNGPNKATSVDDDRRSAMRL